SRTVDPEEFIVEARGAVVAMVQYVPVTPRVIDALPECRGYIRNGIGYNNLDHVHAQLRGKYVANVPDYCIDEVSNHALGMLLTLSRKLAFSMHMVHGDQYRFENIRPIIRLNGSTLGIVGLGRIGKALAEKARPLVQRILFYDPYVARHPFAVKITELAELFAQSDNVSLHTPLTDETRGMINRPLLEKLPAHANLINTSRGGIVDEKALLELLRGGRLAGAGLDVFAEEPIKADNPFLGLDNTIVTSHSAWYSEGALRQVKISWTEQAIQVALGAAPQHNVY
ncbi:MAG: C-terminal binding protein, partial [Kiritimatiellia bacterium]